MPNMTATQASNEEPLVTHADTTQLERHPAPSTVPIEEAALRMSSLKIEDVAPAGSGVQHTLSPSHHSTDWPPELLRYPETLGTLICIKQTDGKGSGVFALQDIPAFTELLCEKPLLVMSHEQWVSQKITPMVNNLSSAHRKAYFELHAFYPSSNHNEIEAIWATNSFAVGNPAADLAGVFEVGSRFNHHCVPNTKWVWKAIGSGMMIWQNLVDIKKGEEVTISYSKKREELLQDYGFDYGCEAPDLDGSRKRSEKDAGFPIHTLKGGEGTMAKEESDN